MKNLPSLYITKHGIECRDEPSGVSQQLDNGVRDKKCIEAYSPFNKGLCIMRACVFVKTHFALGPVIHLSGLKVFIGDNYGSSR